MSDTKALQDVVAKALAKWGNGEAQDAFEALMGRLRDAEKERDEDQGVIRVWRGRTERAEADNAALLKALHSAYRPHAGECIRFGAQGQQVRPCPCGVDALMDADRPGTALLEELEAQKTAIATLEKAVSIAHNAALEEAAKVADKEAEYSRSGRLQASQWGQREVATKYDGRIVAAEGIGKAIRALKKTGQGA